jgi:hypothetical protein
LGIERERLNNRYLSLIFRIERSVQEYMLLSNGEGHFNGTGLIIESERLDFGRLIVITLP